MISAYTNALIVDGTGQSFNGYMVVEDDHILEVGPGEIPVNIKVDTQQNLKGLSLLPGTIDCHVHLYSDGDADPMAQRSKDTPGLVALRAARNASLTIQGGVTTVRDCGSRYGADFALKKAA